MTEFSKIPGGQAKQRPDNRANQHGGKTGSKRNARARKDAAEDVAPEGIHAEPMLERGASIQHIVVKVIFRIIRHKPRPKDGDQNQQANEAARKQRHALPLELAPEFAPRSTDFCGAGCD